MRVIAPGLALALALLAGCNRRPDSGPVMVSVIGGAPRFAGSASDAEPDRVLVGAVAEGLVRFDAAGQVEPGLAERWIVIDGGASYIFRLRAAEWSDGRPVTAAQVVTILRRAIDRRGSALAPFLTAIDEIVEMTPQVIEVRLSSPRPDLLKLFAQPELAIARLRPPGGGGPFRIVGDPAAGLLLRPGFDPARADEVHEPRPEADVRLIGERAALAIGRFARRESDLVLGGTVADWPLLAVADIAPANLRIDPAAGLFGLAIVRREGWLADAANRSALAAAIDRAAIVAGFAPGATPVETILPERLDSAAPPQLPDWTAGALAARRAEARRRVAAWRGDGPPTLRIALPAGVGGKRMFNRLALSLGAIGIVAERAAPGDRAADLRLIDRVAPYDSARWYLQTACAPCGEAAAAAIDAARLAPTLGERARAIALADLALTRDAAFIPLGRPLRWSLVALRLAAWQENARAWHPLNHLRVDPD